MNEPSGQHEASPETMAVTMHHREWWRGGRWAAAGLAFAVVLAILLAAHFTPFGDVIERFQQWIEELEGGGEWTRAIFVAATAGLVAAGAPRLLLSFVGGMVFGAAEGVLWSVVGSLIGAFVTYRISRRIARRWARRRLEAYPRLARFVHRRATVLTVALVRQLPAPSVLVNVTLGMMKVRSGAFLIGSAIGFLPGATVAALCGAGMVSDTFLEGATQVMAAAGVFIVLAWAARALIGRFERSAPDQDMSVAASREESGIGSQRQS